MEHHKRLDVCNTRPKYRDGRKPTAVKTYTISQESNYLLIFGVPALGVTDELAKLLSLYGKVDSHKILSDYQCESFTKVMSVKIAKRKLDDYAFYGGTLHVCYAPEYESISETRDKLKGRKRGVAFRLRKISQEAMHLEPNPQINTPSVSCPEILDYNPTDSSPCVVQRIEKSDIETVKPTVPVSAESEPYLIVDGCVVKRFQSKTTAKFVPRSVSSRNTLKEEVAALRANVKNTVNERLRKQALVLGDVSGPLNKFSNDVTNPSSLTGSSDLDRTADDVKRALKRISDTDILQVKRIKRS